MMYFWLAGALSSFLDNAPTYLVFFELAAAPAPAGTSAANYMMTTLPLTLTAISCGALFMGANSYIGNAPNFMVKAIAEKHGRQDALVLRLLRWAAVFLIPTFIALGSSSSGERSGPTAPRRRAPVGDGAAHRARHRAPPQRARLRAGARGRARERSGAAISSLSGPTARS